MVERGGVLERGLLGVPPMGDVKSDGPAGVGIWSTCGVGMKLVLPMCRVRIGLLVGVAVVGGGATLAVGVGSVVVVEVVGVAGGLGVAKAGKRTIEWSSVWAVA